MSTFRTNSGYTETEKHTKTPIAPAEGLEDEKIQRVIILVDNDVTSLQRGKKILQDWYTVYPVSSEPNLFGILRLVVPDLILLSAEIPKLNGYTMMRKLKEDPKTADIPVIFVSRQPESVCKFEGIKKGADDYVTKPFSPLILLKRVETHIRLNQYAGFIERMLEAHSWYLEDPRVVSGSGMKNRMGRLSAQDVNKIKRLCYDCFSGQEVQKKFIPLETNGKGTKLSTGFKETPRAAFFGYYKGVREVSGDYYDYIDLDSRYYAIIKCDVAGSGTPAALIMIQVATMFRAHFKDWKFTPAVAIETLVYQINDFIETMDFTGRFAALILCLYDSFTGIIRYCNAGDNIVYIYNASQRRLETLVLPESPAAGILPNSLVKTRGGYTVQTDRIGHGDILLLCTDGLEEARHKFRDIDFNQVVCVQDNIPYGSPHANHKVGQGYEELSASRIQGIVNAVMNRWVYNLYKYHNAEGELYLTFDFTSCKGTSEEVVMALVAVEKMFRCYKDPRAYRGDKVPVDKKVDAFLKEHFLQYETYCSHTQEYPGNDGYLYYTYLREDDQWDDLTILGLQRK
jgi:DNA-binding response OmpR family regulator